MYNNIYLSSAKHGKFLLWNSTEKDSQQGKTFYLLYDHHDQAYNELGQTFHINSLHSGDPFPGSGCKDLVTIMVVQCVTTWVEDLLQ